MANDKNNSSESTSMNKQSIAVGVLGIIIFGAGVLAFMYTGKPAQNQTGKSPTSQTSGQAEEISIDVPVANTATEPKSVRLTQGQKVTVNLNSEIKDNAHLHGYDIVTPLEANNKATLNFTADKTGRYELELEQNERVIAIFEVYPK